MTCLRLLIWYTICLSFPAPSSLLVSVMLTSPQWKNSMATVDVYVIHEAKSALEILCSSWSSTSACGWATWLSKSSRKSLSRSALTWSVSASNRWPFSRTWCLSSEQGPPATQLRSDGVVQLLSVIPNFVSLTYFIHISYTKVDHGVLGFWGFRIFQDTSECAFTYFESII